MTKQPEINVHWAEEPIASYEQAIIQTLMFIDEEMERSGWDEQPLFGVIHFGDAGNIGSLSVSTPRQPDLFYEDFEQSMALLAATCLTAEIMSDEEKQVFLDTGVTNGFQGWLFSAEFYAKEVDEAGNEIAGRDIEHRMTIMVDIDSKKYGVARERGTNHADEMQTIPDMSLTRSLSILVGASVMSIVRRNLDEPE